MKSSLAARKATRWCSACDSASSCCVVLCSLMMHSSFRFYAARQLLPSQLETLDLAGRGLGEFVNEFDPARVLVRRDALFDERLNSVARCVGASRIILEHHKCFWLHQHVAVLHANHGALQHIRMLDDGGL